MKCVWTFFFLLAAIAVAFVLYARHRWARWVCAAVRACVAIWPMTGNAIARSQSTITHTHTDARGYGLAMIEIAL